MAQLYVPDGVFLVCSEGLSTQPLLVNSQSSIKIAGGRLAGTFIDKMPSNFNCAKLILAMAVIGAIVAGLIAAATVATGGLAGAAIVGGIAAAGAVGGAGAGLAAGFIPSICAALTFIFWTPFHPKVTFEGKPALLEKSIIPCFFGGTIKIFYSEAAARAAVSLKRWGTLFDVGMIAVGAFLTGFTATLLGGATAVKGLVSGATRLSALASAFSFTNVSAAIGFWGLSTFVIDPVKSMAYEAAGLDVSGDGANVEKIMAEREGRTEIKEEKNYFEDAWDKKIDGYGSNAPTTSEGLGTIVGFENDYLKAMRTPVDSAPPIDGTSTTTGTPTSGASTTTGTPTSGTPTSGTSTTTGTPTAGHTTTTGTPIAGPTTTTAPVPKPPSKIGEFAKSKPGGFLIDTGVGIVTDLLGALKSTVLSGPIQKFKDSLDEEAAAKAGINVAETMF